VRTFIPQPGSPLCDAMTQGRFQAASLETILMETRLLLANLEATSEFLSDHVSNLLPLHGKLPEEKKRMLRLIDGALERIKEDSGLREEMEMRRHLTNL